MVFRIDSSVRLDFQGPYELKRGNLKMLNLPYHQPVSRCYSGFL